MHGGVPLEIHAAAPALAALALAAAHAPPAKPAARPKPSAPAIPAESPPTITPPPPASSAELGTRAAAATSPATKPATAPATSAPGASQLAAPPQRLRGVVQWFGDRGYGFIRGEDGRDVFVHRSAIGRGMFPRLIEGQLVEYEVQQTGKGPQAVAVTPLQGRAQRGR